MSFMWENQDSQTQKVLFHFKWKCNIDSYFLDGGAYDHEKEVLLYDGAKVTVESVQEVKDKQGKEVIYTLITCKTKNAEWWL